ncbi:hypothetical protein [Vibrio litoralis]|uniref:hypothetical protein n=1 Tax=Vibrio litoralis TaxID=335972 RepID=UPI000415BA89|nr:hypothetical protein [Vibrio litoralis]
MARMRMLIQAVLAASIFYLGYTIYSFTSTVNTVVDKYPEMLTEISNTAQTLKIDQWLEVADKFATITPDAVKTAQDINKTIGEVNTTVGEVNKTASAINTNIPSVLAEVKAIRTQALPDVLSESKAIRTQTLPGVLRESALLRQDVPPMLAKVDELMDKSEELSKQAAQGAVKGVILSPIDLLKDAGSGLKSKVSQ